MVNSTVLWSVDFKLSDASKADIEAAKGQFKSAIDSLLMNFIEYENGLGKTAFKSKKLSPDSMMQFAFQVSSAAHSTYLSAALFMSKLSRLFSQCDKKFFNQSTACQMLF